MENEADLKEELLKLSDKTKFSSRLLEKDYHLTRILHKIAEKQIKDLVFKGGTCLNKCYLGFYRLSEDLDFVYNKDVKNLTKVQIKKILDRIRRELFSVLNELELKTNTELGKGWKMLTSKEVPKIVGLEITANYISMIDNSVQTIKLEVSFRNKLIKPTRMKIIEHEFVDALGEPILREDAEIEAIDLTENLAEKFRALVIRKNIAIRDIYDIYFILKNKIVKIDNELIDLILIKINENRDKKFSKQDLLKFIESLNSKISGLDDKEISSLLKSDEKVDIKEMVKVIYEEFQNSEKNRSNMAG